MTSFVLPTSIAFDQLFSWWESNIVFIAHNSFTLLVDKEHLELALDKDAKNFEFKIYYFY